MSAWAIDVAVYGLAVSLLSVLMILCGPGMGLKTKGMLLTISVALLGLAPLVLGTVRLAGLGGIEWQLPKGVRSVAGDLEFEEFVATETSKENLASEPSISDVVVSDEVEVGDLGKISWKARHWLMLTGGIWVGGTALLLGLSIFRGWRWNRWTRRVIFPVENERVFDVCRKIGVSRNLLWSSDAMGSPFVTGLCRPKIVLPVPVVDGLQDEELAMVLRHEQSHLERGDLWWGLAERWMVCIFWWNPTVWWLLRERQDIVEKLCDRAGAGSQSDATSYAKVLLKVTESRMQILGGMAMANSGSCISERVQSLVAPGKKDSWARESGIIRTFAAAFTVIVGIAGFGVRFAQAEEEDEGKTVAKIPDVVSILGGRMGAWDPDENGHSVVEFAGGITIELEGFTLKAEKCVASPKNGIEVNLIELKGGLTGAYQGGELFDEARLSCESASYVRDSGELNLKGSVAIEADGVSIWCDEIDGTVDGELIFHGERGVRCEKDGERGLVLANASEMRLNVEEDGVEFRGWPVVRRGSYEMRATERDTVITIDSAGGISSIGQARSGFIRSEEKIDSKKNETPEGLAEPGARILDDEIQIEGAGKIEHLSGNDVTRWHKAKGNDSVKIKFRGLTIEADVAELNGKSNILSAENAVLRLGDITYFAGELVANFAEARKSTKIDLRKVEVKTGDAKSSLKSDLISIDVPIGSSAK